MVQKFNSTIEHALTAIWVSLVIIKELFIYEASLRQNDHWSNLKSAVGICVGHLFSDSMLRNTYLPSFQFYVSFWTQKVLGDLIIIIPHRLRHLNTQSLWGASGYVAMGEQVCLLGQAWEFIVMPYIQFAFPVSYVPLKHDSPDSASAAMPFTWCDSHAPHAGNLSL